MTKWRIATAVLAKVTSRCCDWRHRSPQWTLLEAEEIEQFVVDQPDHVPLIDHHDSLHHVGQEDVEIEVLFLLLALDILQSRADLFEILRDLSDHGGAVDIVGFGTLSGGELLGQTLQLPEGKLVSLVEVGPEKEKLQHFEGNQQDDQLVVIDGHGAAI